ncbi:hypothetical protein SMGD1_2530 [Sulfurimonas gotlandica GD1]|uniref:Uncharacterized protein n=1 Tax=Sulfurimonas gotlandica (strain DSM 19862 / JCM 16533 / GD1) TaxID=929558 RepID=B6BNI0_SULGG|nr:hypothetical protein [Sulfurimonas gotlandica]EDZ61334.1 conserved hypothetical protein [Sulfurimonas gotlandica GD1]EHP31052.1 hypothetical protein SMGD1_2530 [Sulfurimonas gotlandica GD1]
MIDGIWDDGEWISWDIINHQLYEIELRQLYPNADIMLIKVFEELVEVARQYHDITGRYLPVFGELGEIFAEITFGIDRHKPRAQGSDGRLGNDFIEIKTISPEKNSTKVEVKRQGNFNKLLVVKISEHFEFEAKIIDRKDMSKGIGKYATVSWSSMKHVTKN